MLLMEQYNMSIRSIKQHEQALIAFSSLTAVSSKVSRLRYGRRLY